MPLASILVQYLGRKIHDRFERIQASFSDISAQAQENYSGVRLIRAFAREESQIGLFERLNRQYIGRALRLVQLMGMLWPTLEFILGVSMIITLLAGGHLVLAHRISVGQFVAFNTYMILLIWPIIAVGWVINIFQRGTASVKRIDELLKAEPAIDDRSRRFGDFAGHGAAWRDRIPPPHLQLRRRTPGAARHLAAHSRRIEPGHRRPHRLRQVHARQPDLAAL